MPRKIYLVTSYDRGGNCGNQVNCALAARADAERYVAQDAHAARGETEGLYEIEEHDLFDAWEPQLDLYTYWHRGAEVYPDGAVEDWKEPHVSDGPSRIPPVDDHMQPWSGHTQGHCGLHISVFGTDEMAVEDAYARHLSTALATVDGTCADCGKTDDFTAGFGSAFRRRSPR